MVKGEASEWKADLEELKGVLLVLGREAPGLVKRAHRPFKRTIEYNIRF